MPKGSPRSHGQRIAYESPRWERIVTTHEIPSIIVEPSGGMSEAAFEVRVRLWLHRRYYPHGEWENNKTGYRDSYHPPFGGSGAGDLIGHLGGVWVEIENKKLGGRQKLEQKTRQARLARGNRLYIVCTETGLIDDDGFDTGFIEACKVIEEHVRGLLNRRALKAMGL